MVIHEALHAGDRRALHHEEREGHLDVPGVRLETLRHGGQHGTERLDGDLALAVQYLHEPGHVRAFEVVRQADVHVERGDRVLLSGGAVLHPHGVADVLDADAVDGQPTRVGAALDVLDFGQEGPGRLGAGGRRGHE